MAVAAKDSQPAELSTAHFKAACLHWVGLKRGKDKDVVTLMVRTSCSSSPTRRWAHNIPKRFAFPPRSPQIFTGYKLRLLHQWLSSDFHFDDSSTSLLTIIIHRSYSCTCAMWTELSERVSSTVRWSEARWILWPVLMYNFFEYFTVLRLAGRRTFSSSLFHRPHPSH